MKKDIEWAKKEIKELMTEESQYYPHEQMVEREVVLNLIDQLDEPEVLSQEWIDEHLFSLGDKYPWKEAVPVVDLQNLLVPKHELPVIPNEVEKEKLYIVQLPTNLEDDLIILDADGDIWKDSWPSRYKMTEQRIKEIDERYWPFAVEVE